MSHDLDDFEIIVAVALLPLDCVDRTLSTLLLHTNHLILEPPSSSVAREPSAPLAPSFDLTFWSSLYNIATPSFVPIACYLWLVHHLSLIMDVEMQMESKGCASAHCRPPSSRDLTYLRLPAQFGTTSDQREDSRVASNIAASISNAASSPAPPSDAKQPTVVNDPLTLPSEPPHPVPEAAPASNGIPHEPPAPVANGMTADSNAIQEPIVAVPSSQPMQPSAPSYQPDLATSMSSFNDSGISSSLPIETESIVPATESVKQQSMIQLTEPLALPQAHTSDLRTSPHTDDLTPGEVAQVEAQKHEEDNAAAEIAVPEPVEPAVAPEPFIATTSIMTEPPKMSETGLVTPPAQTPPLASQPEHSILPQEMPSTVSEPPAVPYEHRVEPALTPTVPEASTPVQDQEMTDAPAAKVAREREEDAEESGPAPKRIKTGDEPTKAQIPDFKVPDVPGASSPQTNGSPAPAGGIVVDGDDSITTPRLAHMKKIISNLKKSNASTAFRLPVDPVALNIPTYPQIVKTPMDLGTIDNKLKHNQYSKVSDFIADFELIVGNCVLFNGREHAIAQSAFKMQSSFNNQMANLPKAQFAEPSREEKKAAKARQEPTRQAPPRRPSISTSLPSAPTSARSPQNATPSTPFAVGPDGVPLIRRDSTMADGRPKRAIVPPKRNQEFAGGRPKKKKYELQLRFCQEALKEIMAAKHWHLNQYFVQPVDPVALNIPTYFQIIKKPMDLGTVQTKLTNNVYEKAKDFEEDVRLTFKNCYKFNPESDWVNTAGHQLEDMFEKKWATKDDWIAEREPQSEPPTDDDEDDEDESEEDDDSETERNDKIAALQKQIAEMSKQMGELTQKKPKKKSKSPSAPVKKSKSKLGKKEKPKSTFPGLQKSEKKKSVSKAKADRYVTFQEKQYISNGIAMLPEKQMQEALKIIQQSVPSLADSAENEIELDIEEVPNHALLKLLTFVKKYAGPPPDEPKTESDNYSSAAVGKSKKNKPSKHEQEAQIDELKGKLNAYTGGPVSPNAAQSIETGDSSDDDGDSEESEEE
jgi:bromodomain-containing factor 1